MAALNQKATPAQIVTTLPTLAAGTNTTLAIFNPSFSGEIVSAHVSAHTGVATDANSYVVLNLIDNTTTTHTLASLSTASVGVSLTLDTFQSFTLNATNTNKRFNNGDAIIITSVNTGGGTVVTTPTLWLEYIAGTYDS